jgi:hypothetical protein
MFFGERQRLELHCRSNRLFGLIDESEAARALCCTHRDHATGFTGRVSSYRNCPHCTIVPMLEVHGSLCNDHLYMYQIFQSRLQAEVRLKASRTIRVVRTQAGCTCCISNVLSHRNDNVDWWNTTMARRCILVVCIDPAAAGSRKPLSPQLAEVGLVDASLLLLPTAIIPQHQRLRISASMRTLIPTLL